MSFTSEIHQKDLEAALSPYLLAGTHVPGNMYEMLTQYLQILLKWNARTNLTAVRDPEQIIRRHFGESLFAAQHLGECETLLDFGSGAGFPGLPTQLLRPEIHVTLAESQNKKATFLREVIRTLNLKTAVWSDRVEAMSQTMQFDVVTLRAVDNMTAAIEAARLHAANQMILLSTAQSASPEIAGFTSSEAVPIPGSRDQQILSFMRIR